jgi:hypothetical protein
MYDNTVRLIGFLGKDAEVKSTKSGNEYTVLSLATQASWKDKKSGEYVNRTEWHRMIAWANLSTFAATLKKGDHLWRAHHKCAPFLIVVATYSASRGRKTQMRCHSVFEDHSSCAFFQERCVATERTVNFEPLFRA